MATEPSTSPTSPNAPKKASNLAVRVATAVVSVPLILLLLYRAPAWAFYLLVFPGTVVGLWELFAMTHPEDGASRFCGVLTGAGVSLALFFGGHDLRVVLTVLALAPLVGPLFTLIRLGTVATTAFRAFAFSMGPLYVAVPLALLALLRGQRGDQGPGYVVLTLAFAWLSDTGGYFAGRFWGKHKLYEAVSPKKTWEGALGGLGAALLAGIVAHFWFLPALPLAHAIPLSLMAGGLGQAGDLAESLIKRSTGVKDSGQIVPGHGGILDRVDALLVTSTVVYLYTLWVSP